MTSNMTRRALGALACAGAYLLTATAHAADAPAPVMGWAPTFAAAVAVVPRLTPDRSAVVSPVQKPDTR